MKKFCHYITFGRGLVRSGAKFTPNPRKISIKMRILKQFAFKFAKVAKRFVLLETSLDCFGDLLKSPHNDESPSLVIARFCVAKSWQSILFSWIASCESTIRPRNDKKLQICA